MKRILIVIACLITLCALSPAHAADDANGYLVEIPDAKLPFAQALGVPLEVVCEDVYHVQTAQELAILRNAGLVLYAEPNRILRVSANSWNIDAIHASSAWDHQDSMGQYDRRGDGVTVAVVDSGIDAGHSDLNAEKILPYKDFGNHENGVDIWHGTFVAGIIAARMNNTCIDGISPEVTLLPVTITSGGTSDVQTAMQGIEYAASHGADVINLSIGGELHSMFLERICRNATKNGTILVAAAGNYKDGDTKSEKTVTYPAGYDCVVSVTGCKPTEDGPVFDDEYSYFNSKVNISAPGSKIRSLYLGSGTAMASGTSFAAPMVSAMAAIAKQVNPAIDTDVFLTLLEATSTDLGAPGFDNYYGMGFVNMEAFIEKLDERYDIHYYSDGAPAAFDGQVPETYSIADPEITLPAPVRHGYRFLGWYDNAELSGTQVTSIPTASMGERSFYAKWELLPNSAPVLTPDAPEEGAAAPASLDGLTPAVAYTADVSAWFTDPDEDPLSYRLVSGPGSLIGTTLRYTPKEPQADVTVTIRAIDGFGHTLDHTVAIRVGPRPASQPVLTDTDPIEPSFLPAQIFMGLTLYDSQVTSVTIGDLVPEWHMAGESLCVSLPELDEGDYELRIEFDAGEPCVRALRVTPAEYVVVRPEAPKEATAKPASLDGVTSATPYYADVSSWFAEPRGNPLTYEKTGGPGTLSGSALDYIPAAEDASTDVPISVRADDGMGHFAEHTVTVHVGPRPASQPVLDPADDMVALDLCSSLAAVPVDIILYDSQITAVRLGETSLDWTLRGQTLHVNVPPLEPGNYTVCIEFDAGAPIEWPWHVYYSIPAPAESPDAPAGAEATPPSPDGAVPANAYQADVSAWFTGEGLTYSLVSDAGSLRGSSLTFAPGAEDAGTEVSLRVRAEDVYGRSAEHGVLIRVGTVPAGVPVLSDGEITLMLCNVPEKIAPALTLNGAHLKAVRLDGTELAQSMEDGTLFLTVPPLAPGDHAVSFEFDDADPLTWIWHVRECPSAGFADVVRGVWYHSSVDWVVENGLMNGMAHDRFDPQGDFTRAMLVTVLYRAAGSPDAPDECPFADVVPGKYYSRAVAWAAAAGIVNGKTPDQFAPNDPITREQLVTILFRYAGDDDTRADLSGFPDANSVSNYARDAMAWAVGRGIVNGVGSGGVSTLSPRSGASRAQVAAIMARFLTSDAPEAAP